MNNPASSGFSFPINYPLSQPLQTARHRTRAVCVVTAL
ncbi:hypothetical protein LUZ100_gp12 [Pseudomonas phage LUZ100]|uniref:Uncharacterized protein n=1 Tax=Pseudomonas phage LUZ100 TaxID=2973522 RepID=A0A9Y1GKE3_9CAUD|nr:hypothetical protein LUZ100_gp12 [Pseudomonas phage LUZ100]